MQRDTTTNCLFLGAGYTAKCMMQQLKAINHPVGEKMWGTTRSEDKFSSIQAAGAEPLQFCGSKPSEPLSHIIKQAENILISISPKQKGDIALLHHKADFKANKNLKWLGYLSTVGVYGNHDGNWVSETSKTRPVSERARWRKFAEDQWLALHQEIGLPIHIFRLPGIYGKGRGPQNKLKTGKARRIDKPGQVFNRAHVEDIAACLIASMNKPNPGAIYNVADDEPAPPQDVIAYAATVMGLEIPPLIPFEKAEMTEMARSFYTDNRRVSNQRIKEELGVKLKYPTYKQGITASLG